MPVSIIRLILLFMVFCFPVLLLQGQKYLVQEYDQINPVLVDLLNDPLWAEMMERYNLYLNE